MSLRELLEHPIGDRQRIAFAVAATVLLVAATGLAITPSDRPGQGAIRSGDLASQHPAAGADVARDRDGMRKPQRGERRAADENGAARSGPVIAAPLVDNGSVIREKRSRVSPESERTSARRAARGFLLGYLPYLYGQGRASEIDGATTTLRGRLKSARLRVSPAARQRRPRVAQLTVTPLKRGRWHAVATIADGGVARYPVELLIDVSSRGPVVSAVVGE